MRARTHTGIYGTTVICVMDGLSPQYRVSLMTKKPDDGTIIPDLGPMTEERALQHKYWELSGLTPEYLVPHLRQHFSNNVVPFPRPKKEPAGDD